MIDFAANKDNIAFASMIPTDKIIGVYTGSFTMGSAGTFADKYGTVSVGAGLSEKCFPVMIWSNDGGTTWNDGGGRINSYSGGNLQYYYLINCYSTTTDIKVIYNNNGLNSTAPSRTIDYKVFALKVDA